MANITAWEKEVESLSDDELAERLLSLTTLTAWDFFETAFEGIRAVAIIIVNEQKHRQREIERSFDFY